MAPSTKKPKKSFEMKPKKEEKKLKIDKKNFKIPQNQQKINFKNPSKWWIQAKSTSDNFAGI